MSQGVRSRSVCAEESFLKTIDKIFDSADKMPIALLLCILKEKQLIKCCVCESKLGRDRPQKNNLLRWTGINSMSSK